VWKNIDRERDKKKEGENINNIEARKVVRSIVNHTDNTQQQIELTDTTFVRQNSSGLAFCASVLLRIFPSKRGPSKVVEQYAPPNSKRSHSVVDVLHAWHGLSLFTHQFHTAFSSIAGEGLHAVQGTCFEQLKS
jgi:hypothetical protein